MTLSRRSLLYAAAAAGTGLSLSPAFPQDPERPASGLATGKPRPLTYTALQGFLSADQLHWHHQSHYGGALKTFVDLDATPTGNHRGRVAKANSVLLHELYFDGMTSRKIDPGNATATAVARRFGSVDRWTEDFRAAAKSCAGWAVLAYHPANGKLYNVATDSHDDGPIWSGVPLVVVDMFEHAYYLDYQNEKAKYVEAFTDHLDWVATEQRLRVCAG